ncbi:MAG: hypothetical protein KKA54_07455 [Proteobacteria bacterium]|nr:hypothetical protein [Pseudomonadota bacterium]MBU0966200.1 hypothetical protein [Pseudomonadota bacterium]
MKKLLLVVMLICTVPSLSFADIIAAGNFGIDTWSQTIYASGDNPGGLTADDWQLGVGVEFNVPPIPYPNVAVPRTGLPGVALSLADGATARMEFEDLVNFISDNGLTVTDPNYFRIAGGFFPTSLEYSTTTIPSMNHSINILPGLADFSKFDGSQIVDGYLVDYIEWTLGDFTFTQGPLVTGTYGSWYEYQIRFESLKFEVHGTKAGNPVPIPGTILLFGSSLAGLAGYRLRRKKK